MLKYFIRKTSKKEKKADIFEKDGSWKRSVVVSKVDSGKSYFTRVRIILNDKFKINTISYLDWQGQVYEVFVPHKWEYENILDRIDKSDTIIEGTTIKSITQSIKYPKQLIKSYEMGAYSYLNESIYYYDSLSRVKEICNTAIVNNDTTFSKSIITYQDSIRIKTVQGIYLKGNFNSNRKEFFYNEKGILMRETLVKNESDSLINEEYVYNGDTTIHNYRFKRDRFSNSRASVILWQHKSVRGLELERLYYVDNKLDFYRIIFKYRRRFFL